MPDLEADDLKACLAYVCRRIDDPISHGMKFLENLLRWAAVLLCGGLGLWTLGAGFQWLFQSSGGFGRICIGLAVLLLASPWLCIAYFCVRRRYDGVVTVLASIGSLVVFFVVVALSTWLGSLEWLRKLNALPWLGILGLVVGVIGLFAPFYAMLWFFDACHRWAGIRLPETKARKG